MRSQSDRYKIRRGRESDVDQIARLQAAVQLQAATGGEPHAGISAWAQDLLTGHPSVVPDDFLVVEETATGRLAASLVGLRQEWSLAGIWLPVVQVELVGTAPEHRGNRLTERLLAALHDRCATDRVPLQIIEGIPHFYRRFGYDYALANGGAPTMPANALPDLEASRPDVYRGLLTVRPATAADADGLANVDRRQADGDALVCPRNPVVWRYEIMGRRAADIARREIAVLLRGEDVQGFLVHGSGLSAAGELTVFAATCEPGAHWPEAAAAMYAHLGRVGRRHATTTQRPFHAVRPLLDADHPLARIGPRGIPARPGAWYARTGDPIELLARLAPLLRNRWQAADLRWPEPTLVIDTYTASAHLHFADGELTTVTAKRSAVGASVDGNPHAAIPPGALLHLTIGHRTLPEVLDTWPDAAVRDGLTEQFLTAAFPRVPPRIWPRN
ncbi:GNAT family N-acetyltransferase [Micromonospora sp. WMMA1363]|uniref:GNAT family N-acetyltransferase n=1 Tax=Micromonospora sp. WMMA1363 TaxID=3053985 RepID=UPI00259CB9A5|nr:GNAT family N-acetyltransferase [Micromonospora sp. WMMA1363]MDM4722877.1 GNAT family N-acetyltransferase [Micromonospora sp. WMMA1363]